MSPHRRRARLLMTRVKVDPGICGLPSVVEAEKVTGKRFAVRVRSECPMVRRLGEELVEVSLTDLFQPILENPVHRRASQHLRHASCPVTAAIIKAVEVEAGMALPRSVVIEFDRGDEKGTEPGP